MLKKETITAALQGLVGSPYSVDPSTINLCINLINQLPEDDQWMDPRVSPPAPYETVIVALHGFPVPHFGYKQFEGTWIVDGKRRTEYEIHRWKNRPEMPQR